MFNLLLILCVAHIASSLNIKDNKNGELVKSLLNATADDYVAIAMGDPQYWHVCETADTECKRQSAKFRKDHGADEECKVSKSTAKKHGWDKDELKEQCRQIESNWANDVQLAVVRGLIDRLGKAKQPRSLILAGDLTNLGSKEQLDAFEKGWTSHSSTPIYPGLGNKDYEENLPKCDGNICGSRMLKWLIQYAKGHNLTIDYNEGTSKGQKTYNGSFATSGVSCNAAGKQCAKIINLNNYVDYTNSFTSEKTHWKITKSTEFLKKQLQQAKNDNQSIFIVTHQLPDFNALKTPIKSMNLKNPIFVLHAHKHEKHQVTDRCAGIQVPEIFAGSVPNNRFTVIKMPANDPTTADVFLMSANPDKSATIVSHTKETFKKC